MEWTTIGRAHFNLDRITSFRWQDGFLYLVDTEKQPFRIPDKEQVEYKHLCERCCVNEVKQDG